MNSGDENYNEWKITRQWIEILQLKLETFMKRLFENKKKK